MHFPYAQCYTVHSLTSQGPEVEGCGLFACSDLHHYVLGNVYVKDVRWNKSAAGSWCDASHLYRGGRREVKERRESNWCSSFWLFRMETPVWK